MNRAGEKALDSKSIGISIGGALTISQLVDDLINGYLKPDGTKNHGYHQSLLRMRETFSKFIAKIDDALILHSI